MYFLRRLLYMFFVLVGVSMLIFILVRVIPGDPIALALGPMADKKSIEDLRHQMGLDRPVPVQYWFYVKGVMEGKLGVSLIESRDVGEIIWEKFPATLELTMTAMILAVVLAVPLGVGSALHRNRWFDHVNRISALFGVSFPQFWIGLMFQLLFGFVLGLLPITGRISGAPPAAITRFYLVDSLLTLNFPAFWDSLYHIALPAVVLSWGPLATVTRLVRANMIDQMNRDYINVSRATGMSRAIISYKYMLRNAFSSSMTMIGYLIPLLLGTAFVIEKVFAWPGIARFGADAILGKDFNGVVGVTLAISLAFVVLNFIVDELYGVLDPRIKLKR
jgi:peptide/nickel transport system permease protein